MDIASEVVTVGSGSSSSASGVFSTRAVFLEGVF
jgi:hypothetical protein